MQFGYGMWKKAFEEGSYLKSKKGKYQIKTISHKVPKVSKVPKHVEYKFNI